MPDPALLLLACATCTGNVVAQIPVAHPVDCTANPSQSPCVSPPEPQDDRQFSISQSLPPEETPNFAASGLQNRPMTFPGTQGPDVTHLQTCLRKLGHYQGPIDGLYGPATETAVMQFQQAQGLGVDGIVGENTWNALDREQTTITPSPDSSLTLSGDLSIAPGSFIPLPSPVPATPNPGVSPILETQFTALRLGWWVGGLVILTVAGGSWVLVDRKGLDDCPELEPFPSDATVVLQPSPVWLQGIIWTLVGLTSFGILWACTAEVEESVPAQGQLQPQTEVNPVQVPIAGVVRQVHVREGQAVQPGDLLVTLDQSVAQDQLLSLRQIRQSLIQENQFYRQQLLGTSVDDRTFKQVALSEEMQGLVRNRATLLSENALFRAQIEGGNAPSLSLDQQARLSSLQSEFSSRTTAAQLAIGQLEKRRNQIDVQIASARSNLVTNQNILQGLNPLVKEGAIARIPYLRQEQEVNNQQSEVNRLIQERAQADLSIAQARAELENTIANSRRDLHAQMAANQKQIAEIESQMSKAIVENTKRISELDSQISQVRQTLRYQDVRATIAGVVFDLKAQTPGFVANSNDPILKIVPQTDLVAEVFVTNRDIGFVRPRMPVAVRVESFPYTEYGELQGELVAVGADALPPDSMYPFYRFPAKIRLREQALTVGDRAIPLQSGMAVNTHIKVRKRKIITLVTDLFTQKVDSLSTVR
ncbi:MAG: HlyD family efflux transporter periplasmic adaptor subunit [Leptolyngbyaceae cyanobacterium bins.59]|nr:HlyD family efflux transporter periplasmic adaptor subunit [Leptolyngbyaceae cyanobacterium bins.59]